MEWAGVTHHMEDPMTENVARLRISAHLATTTAELRRRGSCARHVGAFADFLRRPGTLKSPSLIVRCRVHEGIVDYDTVVEKETSRWRLTYQFRPFMERLRSRLVGEADFLVLLSDTMYVADAHQDECVDHLRRAPMLRCDWYDGDPVSVHAIAIPDFSIQDEKYGEEIGLIVDESARVGFDKRESVIKWRGRLTGPGFPDMENRHNFARYHLLELSATMRHVVDAKLTHRDNFPATPSGRALLEHLDALQGGQASEIAAEAFVHFKYLLSVDGVTSTWKRIATCLWTGSVLVLHHRWRQFYFPGLEPWVHYVPVRTDFSDLAERFVWLEANPVEAACIARRGRQFAEENLSVEALESYFVEVFDTCAAAYRPEPECI